jgi:hypothetical protein
LTTWKGPALASYKDSPGHFKGLQFFCGFFPVFFIFSRFRCLIVFIGICSVLQLSSLICMVLVTFGVWIPQARDILNTRDDENGHEMS